MRLSNGKTLHANWNLLIDEFNFSTKQFYELLTRELESHNIKKINIKEKYISTGNVLGVKRIYLRVKWKSYVYDCCLAPFGNGTFISWWMFTEKKGLQLLLSRIPFLGAYLENTFYPITYYSLDTASMFRSYAQTSVLKVIEDITKDTGVRISDFDKKPVLSNIFKR